MEISEKKLYDIAFALLYRNRLPKGKQLLQAYGSSSEAWKHIDEPNMQESLNRAEKEAEFVERHEIQCWSPTDEDYPHRLKECPDAPLILFAKGNIRANTGRMVSVVGTRGCTERGKEMTRRLVLDLAAALDDVTIISGLAYGIDIAAHRAALEAKIPTIICVGHGMDRIYPAVHRREAIHALDNGGVLSEYISGTEPDRFNFVARDRIIAGLADAVVVVESKEKGGSLLTAQMAQDYSRSLFAFPGRIQDDTSRGCNNLIRDQKAALITSAHDLIQVMMWNAADQPRQTQIPPVSEGMSEEESRLFNLLHENEDGIHINDLMNSTALPYSSLISTLMMMEMKGWVKSMPGNIYRTTV